MNTTTRISAVYKTASTPGVSLPDTLHWKSPWWAWQLLSLALTTVTAPSFLIVGILLAIDSHSDHPLFWLSLPCIVVFSHAAASTTVNQRHHRQAFTHLHQVAAAYNTRIFLCGALFLFTGYSSGFLPDFIAPLINNDSALTPVITTVLWSVVMAAVFAFLSFFHAGFIHARLVFHKKTLPLSTQPSTTA